MNIIERHIVQFRVETYDYMICFRAYHWNRKDKVLFSKRYHRWSVTSSFLNTWGDAIKLSHRDDARLNALCVQRRYKHQSDSDSVCVHKPTQWRDREINFNLHIYSKRQPRTWLVLRSYEPSQMARLRSMKCRILLKHSLSWCRYAISCFC